MMKQCVSIIFAVLFLFIPLAHGSDSFRLESGQLLQKGMTKAEVLDKAGKPKTKDKSRKSRGHGKKEVWTYFINDTFGTPSIVTVSFEGSTVVKVKATQRKSR